MKLAAILSRPQCVKYLVSNRIKKIIQFYLSYTPYFLWKAKHEGFCITVYCFTITCFYWPTLDNIYGKSRPKHIMLLPIYEIIYKPVVSDNIICIRTLVFIFRLLGHDGHNLSFSSSHWLSGKLWYLQHNCVGDTTVYHQASKVVFMFSILILMYLKHF